MIKSAIIFIYIYAPLSNMFRSLNYWTHMNTAMSSLHMIRSCTIITCNLTKFTICFGRSPVFVYIDDIRWFSGHTREALFADTRRAQRGTFIIRANRCRLVRYTVARLWLILTETSISRFHYNMDMFCSICYYRSNIVTSILN